MLTLFDISNQYDIKSKHRYYGITSEREVFFADTAIANVLLLEVSWKFSKVVRNKYIEILFYPIRKIKPLRI